MSGSLGRLFEQVPEDLRDRALTHSSWVDDRELSFWRLAFLGDSVLGLSVADEIFRRNPHADIGDLTRIQNQVVSGRSCAEVATRLGLHEQLLARAPEGASGVDAESLISSERTLASLCEVVIGACHIAHGYATTSAAVVETFGPLIDGADSARMDPKSELQETLARTGRSVEYEVTDESGPAHERVFRVVALCEGETLGEGEGKSKKDAEREAASKALEALGPRKR